MARFTGWRASGCVDAEFTVLLYEFKNDIAAYLSGLRHTRRDTRMRTLADLIAFNDLVPQAFSPDNSMGSVSNMEFHGKLSNVCPWASQIWDTDPVDGRMFQQIMIEGMDPEQAWTEAYETLATIREEWLAENGFAGE